jgi:hypothetical protein
MRTESKESEVGLRFTLNQLLIAITAFAVPLALISRYWVSVNDTVDERTIPFSNVGALRQSYLIGGLILLGILAIVFGIILVRRRLYYAAASFSLVLLICVWPVSRQIESEIVSPVQGNDIAETHNDAAAIAATAVERYYSRTKKWPQSWLDLDDDITSVIADITTSKPQSMPGPFASGDPFSADPSVREESQSIFSRSPDLTNLTAQDLQGLVDIDFDADPRVLANMNWVEFTGIVPHKPAYNTYRVEFGKLITRLEESLGRSEPPQEAAK